MIVEDKSWELLNIMENAILKKLCIKLGINYEEIGPGYFPNQVKKLKELYDSHSK